MRPVRESTTRYAILGVLTLGPMSGYDIQQTIQRTIAHFWRESYGQLYPSLAQLDAEGLVSRHVEPQTGRPDRHVYSLTPAGWTTLRAWLAQPVTPRRTERNELLVKLFFGRHIGPARAAEHVRRYRDDLAPRIELYRHLIERITAEEAQDPDALYWLLTLRYGQVAGAALLSWCDESLERLAASATQNRTQAEPPAASPPAHLDKGGVNQP